MAYTPYEWQDLPSLETPIVAEKLNHIEQGIKNAHDDISGVVEAVAEIDETIGIIQSALSGTQEDVDALETKATNTDIALAEIKLLGWTVPEECPIKNSLSGNVFTQRVGRVVDLGSLNWTYFPSFSAWYSDDLWGKAKGTLDNSEIAKMISANYISSTTTDIINTSTVNLISITQTGSAVTNQRVWCRNDSTTTKPSGYLYYELSTPITKNVEGNEILLIKQEFINPIYLGELVWQTSTAGKYYTLLPYSYNDIIFATIKDFGSLRANDNLQIALRANGKEILILSNTNTFYQGAYIGLSILHKG